MPSRFRAARASAWALRARSCCEPEILFLDEPTASIDEENTAIIESIIAAMKQEGRTIVIMTTHDRSQAERLADHLLVLKQGASQRPDEPDSAVSSMNASSFRIRYCGFRADCVRFPPSCCCSSSNASCSFIPTLLGITLITFILMQSLPGDPVLAMVGERSSPETIARIRQELGQDKPLPVQYLGYLKLLSRLELGRSNLHQQKDRRRSCRKNSRTP